MINFGAEIHANKDMIEINTFPGQLDMLKNIPNERLKEFRTRELISTPISADQVAESVYFLLSDNARHITRTTLDINNGNYLQ